VIFLLKIEQMLSLSERLLTKYIAMFAEESSRRRWRWLGVNIELYVPKKNYKDIELYAACLCVPELTVITWY
jgi:hypothetical protein